jgi:uncharacterized protein (DUF488 family)
MPFIFTIGHSTHTAEAFARLLGQHEVRTLADVRRHPGSRRVPWTNAGEVERALPVDYVHLPELGGRRRPAPDSRNGWWENDQFRGYADHMTGDEFAGGLERLLRSAGPTAVMCAEAQWWRCHRRLLADALAARGFEVLHIDARGELEPHRLTEAAVVDGDRISYPPSQGELPV